MVGKDCEQGGIAKNGAKMVTAVATARVPKLTVVIGGSSAPETIPCAGKAYSPAVPLDVAGREDLRSWGTKPPASWRTVLETGPVPRRRPGTGLLPIARCTLDPCRVQTVAQ